MNLNDINVDVALSTEQQAELTTAVTTLDDALAWLISVAPTSRKRLMKLGPKSEGFVQEAVNVVRDYGDLLPTGLSLTEVERDVAIRNLLLPIQQRLEVLLQKVKDTQMVAGADLMQAATLVYRSLQSHGHTAGLDPVKASLARRFARSTPVTEPETPTEPAPAMTPATTTTGA